MLIKFILKKLYGIKWKLFFKLRNYFYRNIFASCGHQTVFLGKVYFYNPHFIHIGEDSLINENVFLNASDFIEIGNNVTVSAGVFITTTGLETEDIGKFKNKEHFHKKVVIGDNAWIGMGAIILPGVIIGEGSVIGAGAVVTANLEPYGVYVGVPARMTRRIIN